LSTVQRVARNVKRWREGDQPLRWTATGLLEAERKFRRIKGYQEILLLKERLNPSRIQQKEVRIAEVVEVARPWLLGRFTVPNIESHCNQLKLGHPPL
jgi:hypothetical protein